MSGYFLPGATDPEQRYREGKEASAGLGFDVQIRIADPAEFFRDPRHTAELTGTVSFPTRTTAIPIRNGRFELFSLQQASRQRRMIYSFAFDDGRSYYLHGHKEIEDDRERLDLVGDMTTLFTVVYAGCDMQAPCTGRENCFSP